MDYRAPLSFIACLAVIATARSGQLPLTVKEISLMLRTGYSSAAVSKELATRHFADTFTGSEEHLLQQTGATPELLNALKQGVYSLSAEQTTIEKQKMADVAKRQSAEGERLRFNTLYRDQLAQSGQAGITKFGPTAGPNIIRDLVRDQLVAWQNGSLTHFDDSKLENKTLIGLYFSAHWCGPCRKFTPELVGYYSRIAPQHPEFEIVFVSNDRSAPEMQTYMREANMPWPALDYQKISGAKEITRYAGRGIPCLVLIDSTGKVLSNSYNGSNYVGPDKVLADLDAIFAKNTIAQAR